MQTNESKARSEQVLEVMRGPANFKKITQLCQVILLIGGVRGLAVCDRDHGIHLNTPALQRGSIKLAACRGEFREQEEADSLKAAV